MKVKGVATLEFRDIETGEVTRTEERENFFHYDQYGGFITGGMVIRRLYILRGSTIYPVYIDHHNYFGDPRYGWEAGSQPAGTNKKAFYPATEENDAYYEFYAQFSPPSTTQPINCVILSAYDSGDGAVNPNYSWSNYVSSEAYHTYENKTNTINLNPVCYQEPTEFLNVYYRLFIVIEADDRTPDLIAKILIEDVDSSTGSNFFWNDNFVISPWNIEEQTYKGGNINMFSWAQHSIGSDSTVTHTWGRKTYQYPSGFPNQFDQIQNTYNKTLLRGGASWYDYNNTYLFPEQFIPSIGSEGFTGLGNLFSSTSGSTSRYFDAAFFPRGSGKVYINGLWDASLTLHRFYEIIPKSDAETTSTGTYRFYEYHGGTGSDVEWFLPLLPGQIQYNTSSTAARDYNRLYSEFGPGNYKDNMYQRPEEIHYRAEHMVLFEQGRTFITWDANGIMFYDLKRGKLTSLDQHSTPAMTASAIRTVRVNRDLGIVWVACEATGIWQITPDLNNVANSTVVNYAPFPGTQAKCYALELDDNNGVFAVMWGNGLWYSNDAAGNYANWNNAIITYSPFSDFDEGGLNSQWRWCKRILVNRHKDSSNLEAQILLMMDQNSPDYATTAGIWWRQDQGVVTPITDSTLKGQLAVLQQDWYDTQDVYDWTNELNSLVPFSATINGQLTLDSTTVTLDDTTGITVGMNIQAIGIPNDTTVASVVDATTITISQAATADGTNVAVYVFALPIEERMFFWSTSNGYRYINFEQNSGSYAGGLPTNVNEYRNVRVQKHWSPDEAIYKEYVLNGPTAHWYSQSGTRAAAMDAETLEVIVQESGGSSNVDNFSCCAIWFDHNTYIAYKNGWQNNNYSSDHHWQYWSVMYGFRALPEYRQFSARNYGWDGAQWVEDHLSDRPMHYTVEPLINGVNVRFEDGPVSTQSWYYANEADYDRYYFTCFDGYYKDNASQFWIKDTSYIKAVEQVTQFTPATVQLYDKTAENGVLWDADINNVWDITNLPDTQWEPGSSIDETGDEWFPYVQQHSFYDTPEIVDNSELGATTNVVGTPETNAVTPLFGQNTTFFDGEEGVFYNSLTNYGFGSGAFTIEGWFYFTGVGYNKTYLWDFRTSDGDEAYFYVDEDSRLAMHTGSVEYGGVGQQLVPGQWYYISYSRADNTNLFEAHINGVSQWVYDFPMTFDSSKPLHIGKRYQPWSYWLKDGASAVRDVDTAPNGSTKANRLIEAADAGYHHIRNSSTFGSQIDDHTFSIFAKADTHHLIALTLRNDASNNYTATFNLNTDNLVDPNAGTVTYTRQEGSTQAIDAQISAVDPIVYPGWYRISITANNFQWAYVSLVLSEGTAADGEGLYNYTGDGLRSVLIWGAQLEAGTLVTPYTTSTTVNKIQYQTDNFDETLDGMRGWIGGTRLTKSICRYQGNYAIPTERWQVNANIYDGARMFFPGTYQMGFIRSKQELVGDFSVTFENIHDLGNTGKHDPRFTLNSRPIMMMGISRNPKMRYSDDLQYRIVTASNDYWDFETQGSGWSTRNLSTAITHFRIRKQAEHIEILYSTDRGFNYTIGWRYEDHCPLYYIGFFQIRDVEGGFVAPAITIDHNGADYFSKVGNEIAQTGVFNPRFEYMDTYWVDDIDIYLNDDAVPVETTDPDWASVVSLLHFEAPSGSSIWYDTAESGTIGTRWNESPSGTAIITDGKRKFGNTSAYFDGNAWIEAGQDAGWAFGTGDFTIEFYVYLDNLPIYDQAVVGNWTDGVGGWAAFVMPNGSVRFRTNGTFVETDESRITAGTFNSVAIKREAGVLSIFVAHRLRGTAANTENLTLDTFMRVGACGETYGYLEGWVDELRITKGVARQVEEIVDAFENEVIVLAPFKGDTIDEQYLNYSSSGIVMDRVNNAYFASAFGKFYGTSAYLSGIKNTSNYGPHIRIDDVCDQLELETEFTIEGWFFIPQFNVNDGQTLNTIFGFFDSAGNNRHVFHAEQIANDNATNIQTYEGTVPSGTWFHYAIVRNAARWLVFLDGNKIYDWASPAHNIVNTDKFNIGMDLNGSSEANWLNAYIQDVRISKVARYASNFTPPTELTFIEIQNPDTDTYLDTTFVGKDGAIGPQRPKRRLSRYDAEGNEKPLSGEVYADYHGTLRFHPDDVGKVITGKMNCIKV